MWYIYIYITHTHRLTSYHPIVTQSLYRPRFTNNNFSPPTDVISIYDTKSYRFNLFIIPVHKKIPSYYYYYLLLFYYLN